MQLDPNEGADPHPAGKMPRDQVVELLVDGRHVREDGHDARCRGWPLAAVADRQALSLPYRPISRLKSSSRLVCSQVNSFSLRPKWPYAAVRR